MSIVLLLEGQTEKTGVPQFLRRWLDARIGGQKLRPICFHGTPNYLKLFSKRARGLLEEPEITGVLGLLDLHGCQQPFPTGMSRDERYHWAKERLEQKVGDGRFRQHFAVHEVEAWLLSHPDLFPRGIRKHIPNKPPETINLTNPPSAILRTAYRRAFKNRSYSKTKGAGLFRRLDPDTAATRCPHLQLLLNDLRDLARQAG